MVHLLAMSLWCGAVAGAVVLVATDRPAFVRALPRVSALALWCVVALGVSGVVNASTRLFNLNDVIDTSYGRLLALKVLGLAVLIEHRAVASTQCPARPRSSQPACVPAGGGAGDDRDGRRDRPRGRAVADAAAGQRRRLADRRLAGPRPAWLRPAGTADARADHVHRGAARRVHARAGRSDDRALPRRPAPVASTWRRVAGRAIDRLVRRRRRAGPGDELRSGDVRPGAVQRAHDRAHDAVDAGPDPAGPRRPDHVGSPYAAQPAGRPWPARVAVDDLALAADRRSSLTRSWPG